MTDKGPDAFRTISEAAEEVGAPAHVLRFWETQFSVIRPLRRAGGRRFYRPRDIQLMSAIRLLLHDKGYSIKAAKRLSPRALLEAAGAAAAPTPSDNPAMSPSAASSGLSSALAAAVAAKARLDTLLGASRR